MSCPMCGSCQCQCGCQCGNLPFTMTATFSGMKSRTHGKYCNLSISSNFGSGATGVAVSSGGCSGSQDSMCGKRVVDQTDKCTSFVWEYDPDDTGGIKEILLTNPGSCYAKLGRVAPTLKGIASPGSGATILVSLAKQKDSLGIDYWEVASVSASGGSGYRDGSEIRITKGDHDTAEEAAYVTLRAVQAEPEITAKPDICCGSLAQLSVTLSQTEDSPSTWEVSGVAVVEGGSGYPPTGDVSFTLGKNDVEINNATATFSASGGSISEVSVVSPGKYFRAGEASGADVAIAGKYYREDASKPPYVANITVKACGQRSYVPGSPANLIADVDTDPTSENFGRVINLRVDDPGGGYIAWRWDNTCRNQLNNKSLVLRASDPIELTSLTASSCFGSGFKGRIEPVGVRREPCVRIDGQGTGGNFSVTTSQSADAEGFPYWSLSSVSAFGGTGYGNGVDALIYFEHGTYVTEAAGVVLSANNGVLTGASIKQPGKFYLEPQYDGTPTQVKRVAISNPGGGYAKLGRQQPAVFIVKNNKSLGTGVTFTPSLAHKQDACKIDYWEIASVSASGNGSCFGYAGREKPKFKAFTDGISSDAFTVNAMPGTEECGAPYWRVHSISVKECTGATNGAVVRIASNGHREVEAVAHIQVNETTGAATGVTVLNGGKYYVPGPTTESLSITLATPEDKEELKASIVLHSDAGKVSSIEVVEKGKYYKESKNFSPYVADVTILVDQAAGSSGSGAEFVPTIDSNPNSGTFGRITKLAIANPGDGYTLYGGSQSGSYYGPCSTTLQIVEPSKKAELTLGHAVYRTAEKADGCDALPTNVTLFHSAGSGVVSLACGGIWNSTFPCYGDGCQPCEYAPCGSYPMGCKGECDELNPCGSGCGCKNGECVECCGKCSSDNDCLPGCGCNNGLCGPAVPKECGGNPAQVIFSITATSVTNVSFPLVGDWVLDLNPGCIYVGNFYPTDTIYVCNPLLCFSGCATKLNISLTGSGVYLKIAERYLDNSVAGWSINGPLLCNGSLLGVTLAQAFARGIVLKGKIEMPLNQYGCGAGEWLEWELRGA